jgi:hypothetical protein
MRLESDERRGVDVQLGIMSMHSAVLGRLSGPTRPDTETSY